MIARSRRTTATPATTPATATPRTALPASRLGVGRGGQVSPHMAGGRRSQMFRSCCDHGKKVWPVLLLLCGVLSLPVSGQIAIPSSGITSGLLAKLDPVLQRRTSILVGRSRVIVRARDAASLASAALFIQQLGGVLGRTLPIINAQ